MVERTKEDLVRLSDESLRGRIVISADGNAIGSLVERFISSTNWHVESIRIELEQDIAGRCLHVRDRDPRPRAACPSICVCGEAGRLDWSPRAA
jgi:hypothetical protein